MSGELKTILLFLLIAASSGSQTLRADAYSWKKCVEMTLGGNWAMKESKAALDAAQSRLKASKANYLPTISTTIGFNTSRLDSPPSQVAASIAPLSAQISPAPAATRGIMESPWEQQYNLGVSIKQMVFNGFRNEAEVDQSKYAMETSELNVIQANVQTAYDLRKAFDQALYFQELVKINESALERRRQNLAIVQLRYEGGRENQGSLLKSQATLKQAEIDVRQSKRNFALALTSLERTMGKQIPNGSSIDGTLRSTPITAGEPDFSQLMKNSLPRRVALTAQDTASALLRKERAVYFPEFAAEVSLSRSDADWPPKENRYAVGLSMNMMLFDSGKTPANVRAASSDFVKSQAGVAEAEQKALNEIKKSYVTLVNTSEQVSLQGLHLEASMLQSKLARDQYTLGLTNFQIWDQIESELITNQKLLLENQRDSAFALAEWEKATVTALEDMI